MATQNIDIDTTISTLQQDLTSIPVEQAIAVIDAWKQQLQGSDLAEDLEQLKLALTRGTNDGSTIAEILAQLSEDTSDASDNVSREVAPKVQQLAQMLSQAAESLL